MVDSQRGQYIIDPEDSAELARLLEQDRILTEGMGGLLAERANNFQELRSILDLGCGPGGWALAVAKHSPESDVWGVDISKRMIDYATLGVQSHGLRNAHFHQLDITRQLNFFPDASFDLINIRYITGFLPAVRWSELFLECQRLLRPAGIFRVTNPELGGVSTSGAFDQMRSWAIESMWKAGQLPSYGRSTGIIVAIPKAFCETGFEYHPQQNYATHLIDYSAGSPYHTSFFEDWKVFYKLIQPFYIKNGVAVQDEIDRVYEGMLEEMSAPDFYGTYDLYTFWGRKSR